MPHTYGAARHTRTGRTHAYGRGRGTVAHPRTAGERPPAAAGVA